MTYRDRLYDVLESRASQRTAESVMALGKSMDALIQRLLSNTTPEERARYDALVAAGEYQLDALIIATGFPFQTSGEVPTGRHAENS